MNRSTVLILMLVMASLLSGFDRPVPVNEVIAVIVNKENPVDHLTAGEVKLYYTRKIKKRWPTLSKNIRPADRRNKCPERETFYSKILGMSAGDVEEYFTNKQLQNAERPQDKFNSEGDMINFVEQEPGAIGFIKASSLTPEVLARVKVVLTL